MTPWGEGDLPVAIKPAPTKPDTAPPEVGIGMLLRNANIAFNRVLRAHLAGHGITFGEFQHLRHLWEQDGLSQVELAGRIGIPKASSTAVLNSLERRGLIRRERNPADRRRAIVHLTAQGAALRQPLWDCARQANASARENLAPADIARLFDLVGQITENLRRAHTARRPAPSRA